MLGAVGFNNLRPGGGGAALLRAHGGAEVRRDSFQSRDSKEQTPPAATATTFRINSIAARYDTAALSSSASILLFYVL